MKNSTKLWIRFLRKIVRIMIKVGRAKIRAKKVKKLTILIKLIQTNLRPAPKKVRAQRIGIPRETRKRKLKNQINRRIR